MNAVTEPKNNVLDLRIDTLSYGRAAVARAEGKVFFVDGAAPGDRVMAELVQDHGSYADARMVELVESGPARVEPPCPYIDRCGGCPWQHVSYDQQLLSKRQSIVDTLTRIARLEDPPVTDTVASPDQFGYRNRLRMRYHNGELGFNCAHSHELVPVSTCLVAEERICDAFASVITFLESLESTVQHVDIASRGELEGLVVAVKCKGRLAGRDAGRVRKLIADEAQPIRGVVVNAGGRRRTWGQLRRRFSVDSSGTTIHAVGASFGQVNTKANVALVETVLRLAATTDESTVLDLYAGAGNFAIPCARICKRVVAVERDRAAVEAAYRTARYYGVNDVELLASRVEDFLAKPLEDAPDIAVLNPPRSGLGKAAEAVAALAVPRVIYVSCNPATLARDLKAFASKGYGLTEVVPVDLFPQTYHVETVCSLSLG